MVKKSLNEKIKLIGFWTFGGVFWYLVVAFFLKSKYPIFDYSFNADQAYDVIKDALTLAAAFLAPVAAFILFSDWRVQHVETRREKDCDIVLERINKLLEKLVELYTSVCREENLKNENASLEITKKQFLISLESKAIKKLSEKSFSNDENAKSFKDLTHKITEKIEEIGKKLKEDEDLFQKYPTLEKNLNRFTSNMEFTFRRLADRKNSIESLNEDINQLSDEARELQISK
ncbi:hypothetical protein MU404_13250 [Acinetobacter baumannii]|uniref:hypothetical protein n=1 Tax=Acinetobacter baumannii TaxID=470 RepID=UPI0020BD7467|nr:hypothetical protein [Acinetobacter baumannii]MCL6184311.1 hypothetical protein [Acinetobacter baumannii]MCL6190991.1 hypothetical protein [Acinetobacter baumannii]